MRGWCWCGQTFPSTRLFEITFFLQFPERPHVDKIFELESFSLGFFADLVEHGLNAGLRWVRARIEHARFETQLVQTKRLVELQVRTAEIRLRTSLERMKPLAVSVEQAEGKLEIAQARFALGQATNKDVTDAQEDIRDGESDLLRSIVDYDIGLAELEASIAGQI